MVNEAKRLGFWHGEFFSEPSIFANVKSVTALVKSLDVRLEYYRDSEPFWHRQLVELGEKAKKWRKNVFFSNFCTCRNLQFCFVVSKLLYGLQVVFCLSHVNAKIASSVFFVY